MSTTIATTHKANIYNFEKIIIDITSFGSLYNPGRTALSLDSLKKLHTKIKAADSDETSSLLLLNNARLARSDSFDNAKTIIISASNYIRSSEMPDNVKENLISISNKFLGRDRSAKKTITSMDANGNTITTETTPAPTHQDMESKLAYLDTFIKQLALNTTYNPNEANIKLVNLTAMYNDMKAKRTAELLAATVYANAQMTSNELLYAEKTGMIDLVIDVKQYVKSVFGIASSQYKTLISVKFRRLKRK